MDSQDKGESKSKQSQESLARRVGEALDQLKPGEARDCPDAEIIAAYTEKGLAPTETARWEGHFATCARCRSVLRVLAASADVPLAEKEVSHLGELVSATRAPVAIDSRTAGSARPSRSAWRTRWLAPAIGVAAVLVVWLVMRPPWRSPNRAQTLVAQAPKEPLPPTPAPEEDTQPSRQSLSQDQKTEPAPPAKKELVSPQEQKSLSEAPLQNAPIASPEGLRDKDISNRMSAQARAKVQPVAPLPPPSAAATPGSSTMTDTIAPTPAPSPAAPPSTAQSVTVTEAAPMIETTNGALSSSTESGARADLPLNGRNFQSVPLLKGTPGGAVLLKLPSGTTFWRAGKGGAIERSTDAGKTWVSQTSPSQQDWLAGAPFSDTVCWLAGRKGAIARTVDGEHWDLIPPPSQAAAAGGAQPDWIRVSALDALSATVTSADGRKFTTSDGGMTWQPQ